MRRFLVACAALVAAPCAHAAQTLPLAFNADASGDWTAKPEWLAYANAAVEPLKAIGGGAALFAVTEPNHAMKWLVNVETADVKRYLVVRYKASNLGPKPPEYALWAYDSSGHQASVLTPAMLKADGAWHDLVVDLGANKLITPLRELAVNVQAGDAVPAELWLGNVDYADGVGPLDVAPLAD